MIKLFEKKITAINMHKRCVAKLKVTRIKNVARLYIEIKFYKKIRKKMFYIMLNRRKNVARLYILIKFDRNDQKEKCLNHLEESG